jgi:hypothetical protein
VASSVATTLQHIKVVEDRFTLAGFDVDQVVI